MGTTPQTAALQQEIRRLLKKLSWSQSEFANRFYVAETCESDYDDEDELRTFRERFKKELQRSTTDPELLRKYLDHLIAHPSAANLDVSLNRPTPLGAIGDELRQGLAVISTEIDKSLK